MKTLNETEVKHSATPWACKRANDGTVAFRISAEGLIIADVWFGTSYLSAPTAPPENVARANAEHIVRCVNSHEALLEACKLFIEYDGENCQAGLIEWATLKVAMVNAIAKAEGGAA